MTGWLDQDTNTRAKVTFRSWCAREFKQGSSFSSKDLDRLIEQGNLLKHDRTTSVACLAIGVEEVIIKRYNPRSQWHRLSRAVRPSRASRCWHMSYEFQQAGLSVARPLLMLERRLGPLRRSAYFISEALNGVELLSALPSMPPCEQRAVGVAVNSAFESMAKARLSHGDLKASNLIWHNGHLYFIDLDAARHHSSKQSWQKANRKDRQRFLKNWQEAQHLLGLFKDLK